MSAGLGAAIAVAGLVVCGAADAQQGPAPDQGDLLMVLNAALYPVEIMAYCYGAVGPEADYQAAGTGWVMRNGDLLARIEALAEVAGVPDEPRVAADKQTLADIEKLVASQADPAAYCELIGGVVNAGQFDLTIRADLQPALKRILSGP
jgi:hypothetical protein